MTVLWDVRCIRLAMGAIGLAIAFAVLWSGTYREVLAGDRLETPSTITDRAQATPMMSLARAGDRVIAVGSRGHVLYSDDDGVTWTQTLSPVRTTLTSVTFIDSKVGWAVGHDTVVLRSTDGGLSWERQLDGREANRIRKKSLIKLKKQLKADAASAGDTETRGGQEKEVKQISRLLEEVERDLKIGPHKPLLSIAFGSRDRGIAVGSNGLVMGTTDGGNNWEDWSARLDNLDLLHFYDAEVLGVDGFLVVGEAGEIHRSEDGGATWSRLKSPTDASLLGVVASPDVRAIYAFGMGGRVYWTTDRGESWQPMHTAATGILQGGSLDARGRLLVVGAERAVLQQPSGELPALVPVSIRGFSTNTSILPQKQSNGFILAGDGGVQVFSLRTVHNNENYSYRE